MVNRVQANVAPLKVQGSIWPCVANGRNLHSRHPERPLRMIEIHHWRCSAGRIDQRSTPAQVGSLPLLRNAGRHMSCPILPFAPPRPKAARLAALHRIVSNRRFHRSPGFSSSPKT